MVFVRVKRLKGQKYGYLVHNRWTSAGPRQKTDRYLGRIHELTRIEQSATTKQLNSVNFENKTKSEFLQDLIGFELKLHGFTLDNGLWRYLDILVDLKTKTVQSNKGKPIVLALNEGYLCQYTLRKLFDVKSKNETENREGFILAKCCVSAGLQLQRESFIALYEKTL